MLVIKTFFLSRLTCKRKLIRKKSMSIKITRFHSAFNNVNNHCKMGNLRVVGELRSRYSCYLPLRLIKQIMVSKHNQNSDYGRVYVALVTDRK